MANFVFNIARGRVRTYYDNVDLNTVAASGFSIVLIETTGLETDATLADYDNLSLLLAGTSNEQTNQGRKELTDSDLAASSPDDTNNRLDLDIPDIVYTALGGNAVSALIICYNPDVASADVDANIIPLTKHDFVVTPDGTDVTAQIAAAGFYRSS